MTLNDQLYRARKAIEWKFVRGWTDKQIAEELDVTRQTVNGYVNDPPEELQDPLEHLKEDLVLATTSRLRDQLQEAERRAREAETPQKVFEYDENGDLVSKEIHFEDGGSTWVPVVKGMEMAPDHKTRAAARQEERRIIEMLWSLAGAEEPDKHEVKHSGAVDVESEVVTVTAETDDNE